MMFHRIRVLSLPASLGALLASQLPYRATDSSEPQRSGAPPLYRVSVVDPSTVAVSYNNRLTPTKINFEGTLLLPHARGDARVLSRQGTTKIEAEFRNVLAPTRFGSQYLTYVLWAITPEGRASNLGQILTDKDHGTLKTSTGLQTFALIVTAEPYYSVTQPSDVVVMENVLRPDTAGSVATVRIQPELLARRFTWAMPAPGASHSSPQRKVSLEEYAALVELYQARNAVNIARRQALRSDRRQHSTGPRALCKRPNAFTRRAVLSRWSRSRARRRKPPRTRKSSQQRRPRKSRNSSA